MYSLIQDSLDDVQLSNVYAEVWETKSILTHLFCFEDPLYFDEITSVNCYWDNVMRNNSLNVTENLSLKDLGYYCHN